MRRLLRLSIQPLGACLSPLLPCLRPLRPCLRLIQMGRHLLWLSLAWCRRLAWRARRAILRDGRQHT